MTLKGKLYLNISTASGIPDHISRSILQMENEVTGSWRVSLITDPTNDIWTLRATPAHGSQRLRNLFPEDQNAQGVQRALREIRDL